jgi:hypothetical protein
VEQTQSTFTKLSLFGKLIGDNVQQLVEEAIIKKDSERNLTDALSNNWYNKGKSMLDSPKVAKYDEAIMYFDKAI